MHTLRMYGRSDPTLSGSAAITTGAARHATLTSTQVRDNERSWASPCHSATRRLRSTLLIFSLKKREGGGGKEPAKVSRYEGGAKLAEGLRQTPAAGPTAHTYVRGVKCFTRVDAGSGALLGESSPDGKGGQCRWLIHRDPSPRRRA